MLEIIRLLNDGQWPNLDQFELAVSNSRTGSPLRTLFVRAAVIHIYDNSWEVEDLEAINDVNGLVADFARAYHRCCRGTNNPWVNLFPGVEEEYMELMVGGGPAQHWIYE